MDSSSLVNNIEGVKVTPLKVIPSVSGCVYHGLRSEEETFFGFGEVYFTTAHYQITKGWKKHREMVLNLIVINGRIRFLLVDGRNGSQTFGNKMEVIFDRREDHSRLTIPAGIWVAFQGLDDGENLLMNIASRMHDPTEAETCSLEDLKF